MLHPVMNRFETLYPADVSELPLSAREMGYPEEGFSWSVMYHRGCTAVTVLCRTDLRWGVFTAVSDTGVTLTDENLRTAFLLARGLGVFPCCCAIWAEDGKTGDRDWKAGNKLFVGRSACLGTEATEDVCAEVALNAERVFDVLERALYDDRFEVNEYLRSRYFPLMSPLGKRIETEEMPAYLNNPLVKFEHGGKGVVEGKLLLDNGISLPVSAFFGGGPVTLIVEIVHHMEDLEYRAPEVARHVADKAIGDEAWAPLKVDPRNGSIFYQAVLTVDVSSHAVTAFLEEAKRFFEDVGLNLDGILYRIGLGDEISFDIDLDEFKRLFG